MNINKKIPFNIPPYTGSEEKYVNDSIKSHAICGDNNYTFKCENILERKFKASKVYLTTSGTSALEMACLLCNLKKGDEVICPSFTFSSSINAFAIFGATPVFVDVRPDTMNINEKLIEKAITKKTKAIMVVHYASVAAEMDKITRIAKKHNLIVIEDAAQAVNAKYKDKYLGTIGDFGCYSFHETKNYSMGEGGAICINNKKYINRATIVREKGTNRTQFKNGQVDKYTWQDIGSSYLPSDILAAYLYPQLLAMDKIKKDRVKSYDSYYKLLKHLQDEGLIKLPSVPDYCEINGHIFYIKVKSIDERNELQKFLKDKGIISCFHYIPLHTSPEGLKIGRFIGKDINTTSGYEQLLRLPMYFRLKDRDITYVAKCIEEFYISKYWN